jgi:prophage DNA circulation protein
MSWEDRIQTAAYTAPSGSRFEFIYENVSVEVDKKTTTYTFPEKDGAFIQDLGRAGRRFPFTLFFSGEDYDQLADLFLLALEEKGAGKLEHPLYGDRIVVPTGTITRRDDLTTGANQAVFVVAFSETIEDITFPLSSETATQLINDSAVAFQENTAEQVAESIILDNANEGAALQAVAADSVSVIDAFLDDLAKKTDEINAAFNTVKAAYEENVANVVDNAAGVIEQAILLTRIPAQTKTFISDEFNSYTAMIDNLIATAGVSDGSNNPGNEYLYKNTLASAALTALCEGSLISQIDSRPQAVEASEKILDLYDDITNWQDDNITALDLIDTGQSFADLTEIMSQTAIYLVNASFSLPSERREVLQDDRNIIEYLHSVGLDFETDLDFFIQINELTADTIEIIPAGSEVVYYA